MGHRHKYKYENVKFPEENIKQSLDALTTIF